MARLYTDENFPRDVVNGLRERGHDVLTAYEAGMANQRIEDQQVLAFATNQKRAVLTINRRDFIHLHMHQPDHAGIIVCTQDVDFNRQVERIDRLLNETPTLDGILLRIVRPQQ
jgi:predicted nuclease of predicted toxin-antitoxin system